MLLYQCSQGLFIIWKDAVETKSLLCLCQPLQKDMDNWVEFFCLLTYKKSWSLMRWSDRHTAAYTGRLRRHFESLLIQQYQHIIFPLKSQWYTALHFHNCKNSSCFPKNYREPKSLFMLLAIWFIVYLQLSRECHAFTLTNYTGGAFRDQLERWELLSAQPKAPVKQNELTACWRVTLLCLESTRKIHIWVQPYSDTISVWGNFRIVSAEQSRAGILYIVATLLPQEPHPSISPS